MIDTPRINPIYSTILGDDSRYHFISGGRGAGKSHAVAANIAILSYEKHHVILYSRLTMVSAEKSVVPEFVEMLEYLGVEKDFQVNRTEVTNLRSGSRILFMGLKAGSKANTARLKSIKGITTWIVEEFEDMKDEEKLFDTIDDSIRTKVRQNRIIMVMNPITREFWAYDRFFTQNGFKPSTEIHHKKIDNTTFIHTNYTDPYVMTHLNESFLLKAERMKERNFDRYKQVYLGGWRDKAEGVIFENWEVGEFKDVNISIFGLDWGWTDPNALIETKVDKENKKLYLRERLYKKGVIESDLKQMVHDICGNELIYADSANPGLIASFKRSGLNLLAAKKGSDSIRLGIKILQDYTLIVDPNSYNLMKELNNYVWDDAKSEVPLDEYNHLCDSMRYATRNLAKQDFFIA